ncbi:GNAT family N-acetyltransferase [Paenibacillus mesophilus]|uniref:GNAT family N-acetyltransferase n=1 Tax=Paenibacillus mesophilus TaxID=2582849 RepID=UPI001EE463CA|nr:N-acetyltransferase [Paenibacillus mesophilus]
MLEQTLVIRVETESDYNQVFRLNVEAFGNREDEARLVERIRSSETFIPELSVVAVQDGAIVGHILLSEAEVADGNVRRKVIALAPIAVKPSMQKRGIGGALIREGLRRSQKLGYPLVLLIGHPSYYPKFGFRPARSFGLELKQFEVQDEVFMAAELEPGALGRIKGDLRYPSAFFG